MKNNVQTRPALMNDKVVLANMVFGNCDPMEISIAKRDNTERKYAQHISDENCQVVVAVNGNDENEIIGFMVVKNEDNNLCVMEKVTQDDGAAEKALDLQLEQIINQTRPQSVSMDHIHGVSAKFQGQSSKMMDGKQLLDGVTNILNGAFKISLG